MGFSALRVTAVSLCGLPRAEEASVWADLMHLLCLPECPECPNDGSNCFPVSWDEDDKGMKGARTLGGSWNSLRNRCCEVSSLLITQGSVVWTALTHFIPFKAEGSEALTIMVSVPFQMSQRHPRVS